MSVDVPERVKVELHSVLLKYKKQRVGGQLYVVRDTQKRTRRNSLKIKMSAQNCYNVLRRV